MKFINFILILFLSTSCEGSKPSIVSPKEKMVVLPSEDLITISKQYDTIKDLNSFCEIDKLWIVGTQNGIYLINPQTKKIQKYFKFNIKAHQELFDGQDSIVGFYRVDFKVNSTKNKILVITSNGIVFQLDLKTQNIEWLIKFVNRIETATYSEDGKSIAIGTGYDIKKKSGREVTESYSSLFLINSQNGAFVDYFMEHASIKKILFKEHDTQLLVAYDWNYTDSYLWDINKKEISVSQFREEGALLYDIAILNTTDFITVNDRGISKWNVNKPKEKKLVYNHSCVGTERVIENKFSEGFIFSGGPHFSTQDDLVFFDREFAVVEKISFPMAFEDMQYSDSDTLLILTNLIDKDDSKEGFYFFNLKTKQIENWINRKFLNNIIRLN